MKITGRKHHLAGLALSMSTALLACGGSTPAVTTPPPATPPTVTWTQVWSDEFDGPAGSAVDATKWNYDVGDGCQSGNCGWGNNEKEYYSTSTDNVAINGQGQLAITARIAPAGTTCYYGACRYRSGKIHTRGKLLAQPGRVEARIKLPAGQGLWPAFWMLGADFPAIPWPGCGELDIMENKGSEPTISSSAVHGPGYSGNTPFQHRQVQTNANLTDDFHIYTVEWDVGSVRFYVDNVAHFAVSSDEMSHYGRPILNQPYFLILNLAVGGHFDGDPNSDAIFPATMLVDYVRVYKAGSN
jgi:beta-glucanase (GH16 family)